jgi:hypothetical protein
LLPFLLLATILPIIAIAGGSVEVISVAFVIIVIVVVFFGKDSKK